QVFSNRSVVAVPGSFGLTTSLADTFGGARFAWTVQGNGGASLTAVNGSGTVLRTHAPGEVEVTVTSTDAVSLSAVARVNLTIVPALVPSFNIQVPNKIACPAGPGSTRVTLNASVTGGEAPYTFAWNWSTSNLTGVGVQVPMTPGQSQSVELTVHDAAGDNASVSRSVLVPPATCGPGLGLPGWSGRLAVEIGIGIIAAVVLLETVVLLRSRARRKAAPVPSDA
ncbi:MAG TPA: hypothetical protein VMH90_05960, partial [Thermoplasmata archaeon]|nr:hypothetical protein [Thermoplasmata archaeon]